MFLIQIVDADGETRWVSVRAGTSAEARNILINSGNLSPSERIKGSPASRLFFEGQNIELPTTIQEITSEATPSPPVVVTGPIGDPPPPSDNRSFLEAFEPTAAFRSALQGTNRDVTTSPFGRTISGLQPFFETGFLADVASRGAEGVGRGIEGSDLANQLRGPFEQFVRGTSLGQLGQLGSQAFQALSGGGGTPGEIPAGVAALRRSFTNPQSRNEREQAARAGILAASQNLSPFAAFRLLPNAAELAQQAQTAQFRDPGQEFLSFLRPSLGF
jgi:hypothetical protein